MSEIDERQPLIQANQSAHSAQNNGGRTVVLEGPPVEPETPTVGGSNLAPTVQCQVCRAVILLDSKTNHHVAKCNECGEATPIKGAPPGKKYVRCPCRCLLICKSSSARIACPRQNCKLTINLTYTNARTSGLNPSGSIGNTQTGLSPVTAGFQNYGGITGIGQSHVDLVCGACGSPFVINGVSTIDLLPSKARCPSCKRINSVGPGYSRRYLLIFLILAVLVLAAAITVTLTTKGQAKTMHGIYVIWVVAFLIGIGLLINAFTFACMPVAVVQYDQSASRPNIPAV